MKFLIILIFVFSSFQLIAAPIWTNCANFCKVEIQRISDNAVTHYADELPKANAQAWVAEQESALAWGATDSYNIIISDAGASITKRLGIQQAKLSLDCGQRVKAYLLVINSPKNPTPGQVKTLKTRFAEIDASLSSGSLDTAREEMVEVNIDSTIMTETDRTALIAELDSCKP